MLVQVRFFMHVLNSSVEKKNLLLISHPSETEFLRYSKESVYWTKNSFFQGVFLLDCKGLGPCIFLISEYRWENDTQKYLLD